MENNQTTTPLFTPLADDAFLTLGTQQIAYIKAVDLPDGAHAVGIFSAETASRWRLRPRSRSRRPSSASTSSSRPSSTKAGG
jgi:hypothetical protein